ncbi:MAG TPA: SGNH/GDSL hydrolase family protein [Geminicoccaceae bacterium]
MKVRLANLLMLILFTAIGLGLAELALRFFHPQHTFYPKPFVSEDFGMELPRNAKIVSRRGGQWEFIYLTNELGRRGPYVPIAESYARPNVVVLGDSNTFGHGVSDDEIYTQVMARHLRDRLTVINGGMGGWGIDSEIKWFFQTGRLYDPKYVVLQFAGNDPVDSFTGVTQIKDGRLVFNSFTGGRPLWQKILAESWLLQNSHLHALARDAYGRHRRRTLVSERTAARGAGNVDLAQSNYAKMLRLFAEELHGQGVPLLFVSVTQQKEGPSEYHYQIDDFPHIKEEVDRLGSRGMLAFIELPLAQMVKYKGSSDGHHWSGVHHEIVGTAISRHLLKLEGLNTATQTTR